MVTTQYRFIMRHARRRGGLPYIKGVGVSVSTLVVMLNAGNTLEQIIAAYPNLKRPHIAEVQAYYAEHTKEIDNEIELRCVPPAGYTIGQYGILKKKYLGAVTPINKRRNPNAGK